MSYLDSGISIYAYENSNGNEVLLAGRQIEDLKAKAAHERPCALFCS